MRRLILLCTVMLVPLGCTRVKVEAPSVLVMVDFSLSAREDLPRYRNYLDAIFNAMPPKSRLVVGKIAETTEATFDPFIDVAFPDESFWTTNPEEVEEQKHSIRTDFQERCEDVFRSPALSQFTNIVSAFGLVDHVFPTSKRRILVLLSDMLHSSTDFDLETAKITEQYIETTVQRLKQQGSLPRLDGVELYVAGARAPTDDRYRAVKKFWYRVFQETGVHLASYGHSLSNFKP